MTPPPDISAKIIPVLKSRGVRKAALFGSVVRDEAKKGSDLDLLVDLTDDKSLLDLVSLKFELENVLKTKVDVLTYDAIHPLLKNIILNEQKIIYEKRMYGEHIEDILRAITEIKKFTEKLTI